LFAAEFSVRAIDMDPLLESTPLDLPDVWPWLALRSAAAVPALTLASASVPVAVSPLVSATLSSSVESATLESTSVVASADCDRDAGEIMLSTRILATAAAFGRVGSGNGDNDDDDDLHASVTLHTVVAARLGILPSERATKVARVSVQGSPSDADSAARNAADSQLPSAAQAPNGPAMPHQKSSKKADKKADQKAEKKASNTANGVADDDDDDLQPLHDVSRQSAADLGGGGGGGTAHRAPLYLRDLWAYVRAHDSVEKQVMVSRFCF
jgi:hypothetical protein